MRIRIDYRLKMWAAIAHINPNELATGIAREFGQFLDGEPESEYSGESLGWYLRKVSIDKVIAQLAKVGIKDVNCHDIANLEQLQLMGDGDCPECGCHMTNDGDVMVEEKCDKHCIVWAEEWRCNACGHTELRNESYEYD